jgi:prepilin-type N-terminal cleavage/methylation domain-containing protein
MPIRSDIDRASRAFTLIELILVMALLATLMALSAPSLSRSFNHHALKQEATRLLALTEYARNEAISQGVPMVVWIDPQSQSFGMEIKNGFEGKGEREKEYTLGPNLHFEMEQGKPSQDGLVTMAEFAPDGTPDPSSIYEVCIVDKNNVVISLAQTQNRWSYEIVTEEAQ